MLEYLHSRSKTLDVLFLIIREGVHLTEDSHFLILAAHRPNTIEGRSVELAQDPVPPHIVELLQVLEDASLLHLFQDLFCFVIVICRRPRYSLGRAMSMPPLLQY